MTAPAAYRPPLVRPLLSVAEITGAPVYRSGHMLLFFGEVVVTIPTALSRYRKEFYRNLADITWGNGSIVVGGGTLGVAMVLGITAGALLAVEGYNALNLLGLGAATGLLSSWGSTRELVPIMLALAFTIQAGCRFTAQLGAMRIAEEVDALEALAIKPVPYLVTTRVLAAVAASVPLFAVCLATAYLSARGMVAVIAGTSPGTYQHYFELFSSGTDILYAGIKAAVFIFVAASIQCYYGYYASGGPEGVGVAAGHAMRATITVTVILNALLTMAMWGVDAGARFGG